MDKKIIFMVLVVMFLSEILLQFNEIAGFVCYMLLITGILLTLINIERVDGSAKLMIILMIFPMIRILELFLHLSFYWRVSMVYYLFLFLTLFYFIKFGFEFKPKRGGFGWIVLCIILGILLGLFGKNFSGVERSILLITIIPIIVFSEELFFRGMVQESIEKSYGFSYSIIITAMFYAIASLGLGIGLILFFILFSLILSIIYGVTKNIWLTMIISTIVHVFLFVL
ncbi:MAG: CPBP family intramembrane glutamic endopeptidase [Nanoarchaeota archaeon]